MIQQIQTRITRLQKLLDSERPVGKLERLGIERQIDDFKNGHKRGLVWDEAEARRIASVVGLCRHWKGQWAGTPIVLEPWQEEIWIAPLFGWKIAKNNTRRFKTSFVMLPRKNAKSTIAAVIGLIMLAPDLEGGAEVYSVATKKDQARIVWKDAMNMVRQSPELRARIKIGAMALTCGHNQGTFQALSSDVNSMDGLNTHCGIVDELHAHKTRDIHDLILTSMGARTQPLLLEITTAGTYDPESIAWEQFDYSRMVLEGTIEADSHHALICCADEKDDWQDPKTWWKANPNMNVSINENYLKDMAEKAAAKPSFVNTLKRLHLNLWTQQLKRWIDIQKWNACAHEFDEKDLLGKDCYVGLDLSTTTDLTGYAIIFPPQTGLEKYRIIARFFMPDDEIEERERLDRVPYSKWHEEGWVDFTPGNLVDYGYVTDRLLKDAQKFHVIEVPFDPYNASSVVTTLTNEGLICSQIGQTFLKLSPASKELERLYLAGDLEHDGNPVLRWMAASVAILEDNHGNIKPIKPAKGKGSRIDGISAIVTGMSRAMLGDAGPSVYESRGLVTI